MGGCWGQVGLGPSTRRPARPAPTNKTPLLLLLHGPALARFHWLRSPLPLLPAPPRPFSPHLGLAVLYPPRQRLAREAAKDDRVHGPDARARQHGDGQLADHGLVDRHRVAHAHAHRPQPVGLFWGGREEAGQGGRKAQPHPGATQPTDSRAAASQWRQRRRQRQQRKAPKSSSRPAVPLSLSRPSWTGGGSSPSPSPSCPWPPTRPPAARASPACRPPPGPGRTSAPPPAPGRCPQTAGTPGRRAPRRRGGLGRCSTRWCARRGTTPRRSGPASRQQ